MKENELSYREIKSVYETTRGYYANELLHSGWILLDVIKNQTGENSYSITYILGNKEIVEDPISDAQYIHETIENAIKDVENGWPYSK